MLATFIVLIPVLGVLTLVVVAIRAFPATTAGDDPQEFWMRDR